jgi:hypothetical protein
MFLVLGILTLVGLVLVESMRRLFPEKKELARAIALPSDK